MGALLRRLDYRMRPRLRRETCRRCWRENPVGFHVPDDVWRAVVPARHCQHVLCLHCFDRFATARRIDWTVGGVDYYAVPRYEQLPARCLARHSLQNSPVVGLLTRSS